MQAFITISHSSLDQKRSLISPTVLSPYFHLHFLCHHLQLHQEEAVFINAAQSQVADPPSSCSSGLLERSFPQPCLLLGPQEEKVALVHYLLCISVKDWRRQNEAWLTSLFSINNKKMHQNHWSYESWTLYNMFNCLHECLTNCHSCNYGNLRPVILIKTFTSVHSRGQGGVFYHVLVSPSGASSQ